jgi:hypothetical protein
MRDDLPPDIETRWEVILELKDPAKQKAALTLLLEQYGQVIRMRLQAAQVEDVKVAFQDFVVWVSAENRFAKADRDRGQFRRFLSKMLTNWLIRRHRDSRAAKRPGRYEHVEWEPGMEDADTPEDALFDRAWAHEMLGRAQRRMAGEGHGMDEAAIYEAMMGGRNTVARARLLAALRVELRMTCRLGLVEEELQYLFKVLLAAQRAA